MVIHSGAFGQLHGGSVLLLGDFNIDSYLLGEVSRISPEAPVPILRVTHSYERPGSAGNAALSLRGLGLSVRLMGRVGSDSEGKRLCASLRAEGMELAGVVVQEGFGTPLKSRIVAASSNQQMMRVDYERSQPLDLSLESELLDRLPELLEGVDGVAVSDYGKGMVSPALLAGLIERGRELGIPVVVDPKGRDFSRYRGATLVKPNLRELYEAAGVEVGSIPLHEAAALVMEECGIEQLLVTRASEGATFFNRGGERLDFGVQIREVRDVTGAGDTVLAMVVCGLANGLSISDTVHLAMVAAGIAVEHAGCVAVTLPDLARRLFEENPMNKLFCERELFALRQLLDGSEFGILSLSSRERVSAPLLEAIRQVAGGHEELLLYIEEEEPDEEFLTLLASLVDVRFILLRRANLDRLISMVEPRGIFSFRGGEVVPHPDFLVMA